MTAYEVTDHWGPTYPMMNQRGSDIFGPNEEVILDNAINEEIFQYLLDNIRSGIAVQSPGGYFHSEEWYAYMGRGEVGAICMPAWYMDRFTNYMPALKGKMTIRPLRYISSKKQTACQGFPGFCKT